MNAAEPELRKLVELELEAANRENPPFHSAHEGYAVILEEADEAQAELEALLAWVRALWKDIKMNAGKARSLTAGIEYRAVRLAAEALQVAAMARKFRQLGGGDDDA